MKKKPIANERIISIILRLQDEMDESMAKAEESLKRLQSDLDEVGKTQIVFVVEAPSTSQEMVNSLKDGLRKRGLR